MKTEIFKNMKYIIIYIKKFGGTILGFCIDLKNKFKFYFAVWKSKEIQTITMSII